MGILGKLSACFNHLRYRFFVWKLNRATKNISRQIGRAFLPVLKDSITAFNEDFPQLEENTL